MPPAVVEQVLKPQVWSGRRPSRDARELRHDLRGCSQTPVGTRQIPRQEDAVIGPDLGQCALPRNILDETSRVRELPTPELHDDTLRAGLQLLDIGGSAERLDIDHLEQTFDFGR